MPYSRIDFERKSEQMATLSKRIQNQRSQQWSSLGGWLLLMVPSEKQALEVMSDSQVPVFPSQMHNHKTGSPAAWSGQPVHVRNHEKSQSLPITEEICALAAAERISLGNSCT